MTNLAAIEEQQLRIENAKLKAKNKIQSLAGQHSDILENLSPIVRKRVEVLREIQSKHDELEVKFFKERAAFEAKYQKLYQPLYTKRFDIVNGVTEGEGVKNEAAVEKEKEKDASEKGVPDFWLNAMNNNEVLADEISESDEAALKYLKDIKWCKIDNPKGFKLEFFFDTNAFFKNTILSKTYHMIDEYEPILEKAIGTEIKWLPSKCLTQKLLKKKPKKGSKNSKPITKTKNCESFFNFFNPPQVPEEDEDIDEDVIEQDYDIGSTICDKTIPPVVSWYSGEAIQANEFGDLEEDEDDDEEDEEDDDDDDEEDDYEEDRKAKKKKGGRVQGYRATFGMQAVVG
ncbi:hypothetical protein UlMin_026534 [Ulmus minor]